MDTLFARGTLLDQLFLVITIFLRGISDLVNITSNALLKSQI